MRGHIDPLGKAGSVNESSILLPGLLDKQKNTIKLKGKI